ncbi:unnamed protein product [Dibothriocephalus latus]|uniref:GAT domain-containing protein n=1 Tax=Dibothriocephalus latus TaxID=60516 RepID=A0A3P7LBI2_DIBLA|nr:unnamed protein product [Dibothriocephalus latus]
MQSVKKPGPEWETECNSDLDPDKLESAAEIGSGGLYDRVSTVPPASTDSQESFRSATKPGPERETECNSDLHPDKLESAAEIGSSGLCDRVSTVPPAFADSQDSFPAQRATERRLEECRSEAAGTTATTVADQPAVGTDFTEANSVSKSLGQARDAQNPFAVDFSTTHLMQAIRHDLDLVAVDLTAFEAMVEGLACKTPDDVALKQLRATRDRLEGQQRRLEAYIGTFVDKMDPKSGGIEEKQAALAELMRVNEKIQDSVRQFRSFEKMLYRENEKSATKLGSQRETECKSDLDAGKLKSAAEIGSNALSTVPPAYTDSQESIPQLIFCFWDVIQLYFATWSSNCVFARCSLEM